MEYGPFVRHEALEILANCYARSAVESKLDLRIGDSNVVGKRDGARAINSALAKGTIESAREVPDPVTSTQRWPGMSTSSEVLTQRVRHLTVTGPRDDGTSFIVNCSPSARKAAEGPRRTTVYLRKSVVAVIGTPFR